MKEIIKIRFNFPLGCGERHRNSKWIKKFVTLNKQKASITVALLVFQIDGFQSTISRSKPLVLAWYFVLSFQN